MRVLLSTYGSRGDTEPVAALGAALQALGAEAVVSAPGDPEFVELLDRAGVRLAPAFRPVRQWVTEALNAPHDPAERGAFIRNRAAYIVAAQYDASGAAAEGCDAIVGAGLFPSVAAARAVAEKSGLHWICAAYCPAFIPSEHRAPIPFPGHPNPPGATGNRALWDHNIETMDALFGEGVNAMRASAGLAPVSNVRDHTYTDRIWLAADPVLAPWRQTDMRDVVQTGAWILPDARPLPDGLAAFLDAGDPPVYVGFGSMPMQSVKDVGRATIAAIRAQGRRAIVLQGWAELGLTDGRDDCFAVGEVNQQALFRRVAAVVHHGGAGTTHAAARAGAPQVVVPQIGDQPYWAARVAELGAGVAHDGPAPTVESLSAAFRVALAPETRARAAAVARAMPGDGAMVAARLLVEEARA
jgi:vancomycin aglycone glucosyltransferase